jgi:peptide methionine sulfoxide reductase MsrA
LIVEAIETEFVPVLVFNNRDEDSELMKEFNEPTWNNPVVRYLDADRRDVTKRQDGLWSVGDTAKKMIAALKAANRLVPQYLEVVSAEANAKRKTATFAMHCFWEGEARLGGLAGVLNTRSGWLDGLEVVEVEYDPTAIAYESLVKTAQSMECASKVFAHNESQFQTARKITGDRAVKLEPNQKANDAKESDQLYYLRNSKLKDLPLTRIQQVKVNARLGVREEPMEILSPRQLKLISNPPGKDTAK